MAEATPWIFLDFKAKQAVLHLDTGESVFVHGHVTGVEGGLFAKEWEMVCGSSSAATGVFST